MREKIERERKKKNKTPSELRNVQREKKEIESWDASTRNKMRMSGIGRDREILRNKERDRDREREREKETF